MNSPANNTKKIIKTFASFEPAPDYTVVKIPKWSFDKFAASDRKLGTQMKATGEVMSVAPAFCNALMKAIRGAELKTGDLKPFKELKNS